MTETQILRAFTVSLGRQVGCKPEVVYDLLQEAASIHLDFHLESELFAVINRKLNGSTAIVKYKPVPQTWELQIVDVTGWVIVGVLAFNDEGTKANMSITATDEIPVTES